MITVETSTSAAPDAWQTAAATIVTKLGRDPHLADCGLAKASELRARIAVFASAKEIL